MKSVFIGRAGLLGRQAEGSAQGFVVEQADGYIGISYVYCKKHLSPLFPILILRTSA